MPKQHTGSSHTCVKFRTAASQSQVSVHDKTMQMHIKFHTVILHIVIFLLVCVVCYKV